MDENVIEVTGCDNCPMYHSKIAMLGDILHYCNHPDKKKGRCETRYELHKQCPLKEGSLKIKLKDNE